MKISYLTADSLVVYLNKYYLEKLDVTNKLEMATYFKKLFLLLRKYYGVKLEGYYQIQVLVNKEYGVILKIKNIDGDYFKVEQGMIEMKICLNLDTLILYEGCDYFMLAAIKTGSDQIYYFNDKYYLEIKGDLGVKQYNRLMEFCRLVLPDESNDILAVATRIQS